MHVVIAPDSFGGTLSAVEAAAAIADGWLRSAPGDRLDQVPVSDGGPGFVDVLASVLDGALLPVTVSGPLRQPTEGRFLLTPEHTAYVESAQACGLHLLIHSGLAPVTATTYGVGELLEAALDAGARRVVVGLGGSATTDGGAGLLAALGAQPEESLAGGGGALADLPAVDLAALRRPRVEVVAATDVDNPLLGLHGASAVFGPQKGADPEQVQQLDAALARFADLVDPAQVDRAGAGAAGGLGYALFVLGAQRRSGIEIVLDAVHLPDRVAQADLVVTGEGSYDFQSLRGKATSGVASIAAAGGVPCVVIAGQVSVGRREMAAAGVEEAHALADEAGSVDAAMADAAGTLRALAARVARGWSPRGPRVRP